MLAWDAWKPLLALDPSILYLRPNPPGNMIDVVGWWEARRPAFNLMLGVVGLIWVSSV